MQRPLCPLILPLMDLFVPLCCTIPKYRNRDPESPQLKRHQRLLKACEIPNAGLYFPCCPCYIFFLQNWRQNVLQKLGIGSCRVCGLWDSFCNAHEICIKDLYPHRRNWPRPWIFSGLTPLYMWMFSCFNWNALCKVVAKIWWLVVSLKNLWHSLKSVD